MLSISQYEINIRRYKNLKSNLNYIITKLSLAIDNADNISNEIKERYLINDNYTPIVSRTIKLKNSMNDTYNYLNNKVIPAIDSAIYTLNRELTRLEQEEKNR